jgi:hypothetical protein
LFQDADPVIDGILFVTVSKPVLRRLKFSLCCVDIGNGIGFKRAQDLSPTDKSIDDFVGPANVML